MKRRTPPALVTLILLTGVSTLSLNMFLPSLANIAQDLDAPYAVVSLSVAGYLGLTAVIQLIIGPLSDRIGRRPVLLMSLAVFTLASIACALATQIWVFLACRMLQGGIVAGYALSLAIVRDTRPEREAAGLIGYISMTMAIAPMLGPMLGGVLDSWFGWRAAFWVYAIAGIGLFALCWIDLGETRSLASQRIDTDRPRLRALLRERLFWLYALCSAFSTGAFYVFLSGAPLVAQVQFGVGTAEIGFWLGSITAGFVFGSFFSSRFAPRNAPLTMMITGRIVACLGLLAGIGVTALDAITPALFFGSTVFVGIGNGITMPSSNAAAMSVRPDMAGSAAGLNGALVVATGALLTTFAGITLPAEAPGLTLLWLMFGSSAAGLFAVLIAMKLRRKRPNMTERH
ncbi:multidrug effflux MFS transporter [Cognatiyoonia sp. IB215182]|uniref:multidrug effflux MFS transporter n=1 Tax=Cognatiyoonia sp. IB215182 TaxID=3097353 RepID=UPI002A179787|nr:multidrug effflux MFS transporter [Cognatiyoonia sp. IB215182]MDX8351930.1 multidrug effflux MFS transporter [Cognatiyoonia sp. IB215182]